MMEVRSTRRVKRLAQEAGATAVEYALVASCIAVVITGTVRLMAPQLVTWFAAAAAAL